MSRQFCNRKFSVVNFMSMFKTIKSREDSEGSSESSDIKEDYELSLMVEKYAPGEDTELNKNMQYSPNLSPMGQSPDQLSNLSMSPGLWDYVVVEDSRKSQGQMDIDLSIQNDNNQASRSSPPQEPSEKVSLLPSLPLRPEKCTKRSKIEVYEGEHVPAASSPANILSPVRPAGPRISMSPNVVGRNGSRWVSAESGSVKGKRGEPGQRCSSFP
ncbi:hypothetical protein GUITHDRAFT_152872, partial [Guillardia theta CCMP2712]